MIMTPPDVKVCAEKLNIPVYQPETFKDGKPLEIINKYNPDVIVVAAYGKILPKSVLDSAKYGCINLHGSLLPKYRGASPIQQSVLTGDKETGVKAMQMDVGLDTGDILKVVKTEIGVNETSGELFDRLSLMGGELILDTLSALEKGEITPIKQDESLATHTSKIDKSLCPIDFTVSGPAGSESGHRPFSDAGHRAGEDHRLCTADAGREDEAGPGDHGCAPHHHHRGCQQPSDLF